MFASHWPDCCTFITHCSQHILSVGPFLIVTGETIFLGSRCPLSSLQTNSCAVDDLGAPGVFLFQLFPLSSTPGWFPSQFLLPTSYSASTFYVLGCSFPLLASSSVLKCSVFNDAHPPITYTSKLCHIPGLPLPTSGQAPSFTTKSITQVSVLCPSCALLLSGPALACGAFCGF